MIALAILGWFAIGVVSTLVLWRGTAPVFAHPMLARTNVNGRPVPTGGGVLIVLAILAPMALLSVFASLERSGWEVLPDEAMVGWWPVFIVVLGFGLLGFVDDVLGDGSARGFAGHLRALVGGAVTTGLVKLVGGGLVAVIAVASAAWEPRWQMVADVALVALAANLANLFDRAPGRVTKLAVFAFVVLAVAGPTVLYSGPMALDTFDSLAIPPVAVAFVVGAAVGLLRPELREQVMLGDAGANVVGAALGIGAVQALGGGTRTAIAIALLVLNLLSERVSFSRVIASTPGLRHIDQWGRPAS